MTIDDVLKYIEDEISKVENDSRYNYSPANVFVNAPLALIQTSMSSRITALKDIKIFIELNQVK